LDCGGKRSATPLSLTPGPSWQLISTEANEGNEGRDMKEFVREQDHPRRAVSGLLSLCFLRGLLFGQASNQSAVAAAFCRRTPQAGGSGSWRAGRIFKNQY
jgi:hypothetical protein